MTPYTPDLSKLSAFDLSVLACLPMADIVLPIHEIAYDLRAGPSRVGNALLRIACTLGGLHTAEQKMGRTERMCTVYGIPKATWPGVKAWFCHHPDRQAETLAIIEAAWELNHAEDAENPAKERP